MSGAKRKREEAAAAAAAAAVDGDGGGGGDGGNWGDGGEEEDDEGEDGDSDEDEALLAAASGGPGGGGGGGRSGGGRDGAGGSDLVRMQLSMSSALRRERRRQKRGGRKTQRAYQGRLPFSLQQLLGDANMHFVLREHAAAAAKCAAVIAQAPSHPEAYLLLALVHEDSGDLRRAADAYRLAAAADTEDAGTWKKLGALCLHLGDTAEALTAFSRAASLGRDDLEVTLDAAHLHDHAGLVRPAVRWFRQALAHPRLGAQTPAVQLRLAVLLHGLGDAESREAAKDVLLD